ncbi:hypothetical protein BUALT_Bualt07G0081200 [Buddleja alternifolia]|uniref:Uncharacterized protein n=1 Tax=Buddleja alternifolia TaxID=168488 RepID=A0AAV6XH69_9LAMI|nr:hypothetical protein BUALT_Bualt07G0081200 [Buddleja alternifolia]
MVEVECSMFKVYRAKKYALELLTGDIKKQFERLYDYSKTVVKHNAGIFKGQLLYAVGRDGNDNIYPIAMAYVEAGSTCNVKQHLRVMKKIERVHPKRGQTQTPFEWLNKIPVVHWARCFFPSRTKCDVIVNNITESFNSYILDARDKPIIEMFEWIRRKLTCRIQTKKEEMERYKGVVCPNILKKLEKQRFESRHYSAHYGDNGKYELMGYPCCHAIAVCNYHRLEAEDFVDDCLKKDTYLRVYRHMIDPVLGMHEFEKSSLSSIHPPNVKIKARRPKKKKRIRDANDTNPSVVSRRGLTHTCGICGEIGHNRVGCPLRPGAPEPAAANADETAPSPLHNPLQFTQSSSFNPQQPQSAPQVPPQFEVPPQSVPQFVPEDHDFIEVEVPPVYYQEGFEGSSQSTVKSEVPTVCPVQSPKGRKQQKPLSLSSKPQRMKQHLNPTPSHAFKRPCCTGSRANVTSDFNAKDSLLV